MQQTYLIIIYGIALHFKPGAIFIVSSPFVAAATPCGMDGRMASKSIFCPDFVQETHNKLNYL